MNSDYFVKTAQFEGPMDLLIHLIKVHEIDVFAIDVFRLTYEYIEYLRLFEFEDLQQAAEFIEMASTLIEIKTRMLLPQESQPKDDQEKNFDEDDPLLSLQRRLIELEQFQRVAQHLSLLPQLGVDIQTNEEFARLEPMYAHIEAPLKGDAASLVVLYEQMLKALSERKTTKVNLKINRISVEETIENLFHEIQSIRFTLFQGLYNRWKSRDELVVHTLAMLELVKAKRMKVYQGELLGPLWMYRMDFAEEDLPLAAKNDSSREPESDQIWNPSDLGYATVELPVEEVIETPSLSPESEPIGRPT